MFGLKRQLEALSSPIRTGIVGIGSIGKGMALQTTLLTGIECVAIADIDLERATSWADHMGKPYRVVRTDGDMLDAIRDGKMAVTDNGQLVAGCSEMDVFVEATNAMLEAGRHAITALESGKHVAMMNYEADLMYGPYLLDLARSKGLVYGVCDGDQPAVLKRVIDELDFMGFQLVMAGNIKGFMDKYSNPTTIIPEADKRNLDYKMCVSYTDGTKLGIEMAVLANGLDMKVSIPGMHGPRMKDIHEIFDHFDFESMWDGNEAIVDYVLGPVPKGGVYAIGYSDVPHNQETLAWYPPDMGPGPFYLFYRPYHLGHFEALATVAEAAINGRAVLSPEHGFKTNVYAYAKRGLRRGQVLDGLGGYASYGVIENSSDNIERPGLPICLAENVELKRDIPADEKILLDDVIIPDSAQSFELFFAAQRVLERQANQHEPARSR